MKLGLVYFFLFLKTARQSLTRYSQWKKRSMFKNILLYHSYTFQNLPGNSKSINWQYAPPIKKKKRNRIQNRANLNRPTSRHINKFSPRLFLFTKTCRCMLYYSQDMEHFFKLHTQEHRPISSEIWETILSHMCTSCISAFSLWT